MDRHLTDDELVLHYYGEMSDAVEARTLVHLDACDTCREDLARLQRALAVVDAIEPPQVRAGVESRVWARLEPALFRLKPEATGPALFRLKPEATGVAFASTSGVASAFRRKTAPWTAPLAWSAAAAAVVLAAFIAGRISAPLPAAVNGPSVSAAPVADRVFTVDLSDHLGRAELALTEFLAQTDGAAPPPTTEDLIAANRLYRNTAMALGNDNVANVLDELERALIEISAAPEAPEADREAVREWIDSRDLLFKVRVMREAQGAVL
jgi:hypothetical protein